MDFSNNECLELLVAGAPIGICILDAHTLVAEIVNESFINVAGKRLDEIKGKFYWDAFAEARPYYEEALAGVVRTGTSFHADEIELQLIRHRKPETAYVTFVYAPLKNEDGCVEKIAVWVLENTLQVTQRQKVEEAQQKAELAISSADLGVFEFIFDSNILIANERFEIIFECIGCSDHTSVLNKLHPDDRLIRDSAHEASLQSGKLHYEARIILNNNEIRWVRLTGMVTHDQFGKPEKVIGVCQDITDHVLAHQKVEESAQILRNMIVQAPVAMSILEGPEHVVVVANAKMIEIWGKKASELLDKPIFEGLYEASEQGFEILLKNVFETGEPFVANEYPILLPRHGSIQQAYLNFTYDAVKAGDGTITGVLVVAIDVTEQVLARQKIELLVNQRTIELKEANQALMEKNGELAQFAYVASHDLQEPLRKIETFACFLDVNIAVEHNEKAAFYINRIKDASHRMGRLITDILAYSSLTKKADIAEEVDLNIIAGEALEDLDLVIERTGASVVWRNLPVVNAVPIQMSQLFVNMIGNSLKFIRADVEPQIKIEGAIATTDEIISANLDENLAYHKIRFSDNGIGISPENTQKIFSIFQRLHSKSEFEGTGIGLATCKKIALNHHGDINAEGSSSDGAVFNVYLPVS